MLIYPAKQPATGSIPAIMSTALKNAKQMETDHMQPLAEVIYDHDGTHSATVKEVKDMLGAAAKILMSLIQYRDEAKALVSKYKSGQPKKEH